MAEAKTETKKDQKCHGKEWKRDRRLTEAKKRRDPKAKMRKAKLWAKRKTTKHRVFSKDEHSWWKRDKRNSSTTTNRTWSDTVEIQQHDETVAKRLRRRHGGTENGDKLWQKEKRKEWYMQKWKCTHDDRMKTCTARKRREWYMRIWRCKCEVQSKTCTALRM